MSVEGGEPRKILEMDGITWTSLAWTGDGRCLLFGTDEKETRLWRVPFDGGQPEKLELKFNVPLRHLCVHPDGQRIAFNLSAGKGQVWVIENLLPPQATSQPVSTTED